VAQSDRVLEKVKATLLA